MPSATRSGSSISAIVTRRISGFSGSGAISRAIRIEASVSRRLAGSNSNRSVS